jgi:ABC-type Na+ transport system ATPase subunit NatA
MRYLKSVSTILYETPSSYLRIACIILVINEVLQLTEVQSLVVNTSHKVAPACNTTDSFTLLADGTNQQLNLTFVSPCIIDTNNVDSQLDATITVY